MEPIWNKAFGIFPKAMAVHEKRAQIIAHNISNEETPNFKAKDIDFSEVLRKAKRNEQVTDKLHITNSKHIDSFLDSTEQGIKYRINAQPSLDGNTVDIHREQAEYAENSMRYLASLRFMEGKVSKLMLAIRGSRG